MTGQRVTEWMGGEKEEKLSFIEAKKDTESRSKKRRYRPHDTTSRLGAPTDAPRCLVISMARQRGRGLTKLAAGGGCPAP